jgi:leader peptidase (prepilin peptidase)/N-methyltransferase
MYRASGHADFWGRLGGAKTVLPLLAAYCGIALAASSPRYAEPLTLPATMVLAAILVALSLCDLAVLRLPDVLTAALVLSGLAITAICEPWAVGDRLAAAIIGAMAFAGIAAVYEYLRGRPGLGLGDAKLLGGAGSWVGTDGLASTVMYAALLALAWVIIESARGRQITRATRLAFGPFLALGIWIVWLYGPAG